METQTIEKKFDSNIKIIKSFSSPKTLKIRGGSDFWDTKQMHIIKEDNRFKIRVHFVDSDKMYYQSVSDRKIEAYELNDDQTTYYIPVKATHMKRFHPINGESDPEFNYAFDGEIDQLGTMKDLKNFDGKFHRLMIPFNKEESIFDDFQSCAFKSDITASEKTLIKIEIDELKFHFFNFKINKQQYWGIDSMQVLDFKKFKSIAFATLAAYGFIKGNLYLREVYYFASDNTDFITDSFHYSLLRDSFETRFPIFTTKPYSICNAYYIDKGLALDHSVVARWNEKLPFFPSIAFSKLTEYFYKEESLSRSAFIVLEANKQPLELKSASYCVAYEGICHTIKKLIDINAPSVINKPLWEENIKPEFEATIQSLKDKKLLDDTQENILSSKINNLNQPTNRDSLTAPFLKLKYTLNKTEIKCIDNRNRFLHGSLPFRSDDENDNFKNLYFNAITIHKLIYILILRLIGFNGYIINYPKLQEQTTGENLSEELFIEI